MNLDPTGPETCIKERLRAGHVKKKGGCSTCKYNSPLQSIRTLLTVYRARHVKCDETKPACLRCLKFWGRCEGYDPPKKRARSNPNLKFVDPSRPILPRGSFISTSPTRDSLIKTMPFLTASEHQGFQCFLTQNIPSLPGLFSSHLWDRIILQASVSEPFVRDTLIAIGALSSCGRKWAKDLPPGKKSTAGIEPTPQYRFALQKYGNAVNNMRKELTSNSNHEGSTQQMKDSKLRLALIACLLVVCFEGLQGNYFYALQHASSGYSLLHDWLSEQQDLGPTPSSSSDTTLTRAKPGLGSPQPDIIEDELINAFSRLDLQIMTYVDARPASLHARLKHEGTTTIANIPSIFTTVTEARLYWELIQRRTSHFIGDTARRSSLRKDKSLNIDMGLGSGPILVSPESELKLASSHLPSELRQEYQNYAGEIENWFKAFEPLYSTFPEKIKSWTALSILKIQALSQQILLHCSLLSDEWSLDSFVPTFRTIVSLGQDISTDPMYLTPHLFTFDLGLVNPIRLVSKWCREPSVRRESIALLRQIACREGIWDALTMASVSEWMMEVEEEKMVWIDGVGDEKRKWVIRKEDRVRTTDLVIDSLARTATVRCKRLGRKSDGSWDERETVIGW